MTNKIEYLANYQAAEVNARLFRTELLRRVDIARGSGERILLFNQHSELGTLLFRRKGQIFTISISQEVKIGHEVMNEKGKTQVPVSDTITGPDVAESCYTTNDPKLKFVEQTVIRKRFRGERFVMRSWFAEGIKP